MNSRGVESPRPPEMLPLTLDQRPRMGSNQLSCHDMFDPVRVGEKGTRLPQVSPAATHIRLLRSLGGRRISPDVYGVRCPAGPSKPLPLRLGALALKKPVPASRHPFPKGRSFRSPLLPDPHSAIATPQSAPRRFPQALVSGARRRENQ